MSIEQHTKAAIEEIDNIDTTRHDLDLELWTKAVEKHMWAAVDEATEPLRERIAQLEGLGPLIAKLDKAYQIMAAIGPFGIKSQQMWETVVMETQFKIDAIMKGGKS